LPGSGTMLSAWMKRPILRRRTGVGVVEARPVMVDAVGGLALLAGVEKPTGE
jgi:hypothetical protein